MNAFAKFNILFGAAAECIPFPKMKAPALTAADIDCDGVVFDHVAETMTLKCELNEITYSFSADYYFQAGEYDFDCTALEVFDSNGNVIEALHMTVDVPDCVLVAFQVVCELMGRGVEYE